MKRSFGKYELIERIGHGGMAEVFRARSVGARGIEKILVIKRILPELSTNERFVEMFIAEAQIAMGLNHPNIVQIYDFGRVDEDYYLAMEFVDGFELGRLLKAGRRVGQPLPLGSAVFLAIEVARGLDYAHRRSDEYGQSLELVHRDISPQNLLVSRDGTVKIVDFGIAKATSVADDMPGIVKGKVQYMSPEQALGELVDHRSDLFSLGVVLFEMVCGRSLFAAPTEEETLSLVSSAVVPAIMSLNPEVPPELERVIYKALAREPDERFQSARELQVELTKILYGLGEIHDGATVAQHIHTVEDILPERSLEFTIDDDPELRTVRTRAARTAGSGGTPQLHGGRTPGLHESSVPISMSRQRKEVVVLTGWVKGLQAHGGDEGFGALVDGYERIVDSIAFKNDAVVHRLDPEGFTILLGIPLSAESDADRAVRMALDLAEAVAGMSVTLDPPLTAHVAVAVGEVILEHGVQSSGRQYRWEPHGDRFSLAASLIEKAPPSGIVVGAQIYRRIRRAFHCESVNAEGYRVVRPKTPADQLEELRLASKSFHGRELQRRLLRDGFRQCLLKERARGMVILGPAGVGKSALVETFLSGLNPREVRVVRGMASPFESDVPLASAASLFSSFLRIDPRADAAEVRDTIKGPIQALFPDEGDEELEWLLSSLHHLFGVSQGGTVFDDLSGEERRRRLFLTMSRVVNRYASGKPVVFAIDDVHYIDPVMRAFAAQFFDRTQKAPVFFLGTGRDTGPHMESRSWQELLKARSLKVETLRELSEAEARELIAYHLGEREERPWREEVTEWVLRRSGGNPLYIRELLAEVETEEGLPDSLPASLEGLLSARLDRLGVAQRVTLQKVALLRTPFEREEAEVLLAAPEVAVLEDLVRTGVLIAEGENGPGRSYRFATGLMQEVAARALVPSESRRLHKRIAEHLLASPGRHDAPLIARHLDEAGLGKRAVQLYAEALAPAFDDFGATETLRICKRVLSHPEADDEQRFEALMWKERALGEIGQVAEADETLRQLEELAEKFGDVSQRSHVAIRRARYRIARHQMEEARQAVADALSIARGGDDRLSMARAWRTEAVIDLLEGARDRALSLIDRAIATLSMRVGADLQVEMVRAYNMRGVILRQSGRHREALEAYETALAGAEALDSSELIRQLLNNSGLALAYVGEFSEASRRYERALEAARRLGHRKDEALVLVNLGHVSQMMGDTERALPAIRRGIYLARRNQDITTVVDGQVSLGLTYLEKGDLEEAEATLEESLAKADAIPHAYLAVCSLLGLAQVYLASEEVDPGRSIALAEEALTRCEEAGMMWGVVTSKEILARALDLLGRPKEARQRAAEAVELLDEVEIYGVDQVLLTYVELLPEGPEFDEERDEVIARAVEVYNERRGNIEDPAGRAIYDAREVNRRIRRLASARELLENSSVFEGP